MSTYYCNFSDLNYRHNQNMLIEQVTKEKIFDNVIPFFKENILTTDFYKKNKKILDKERLCGYALWKPYIILECFKQISYNDIVVYMDCGDVPFKGINEKIKDYLKDKDQYFITTRVHQNKKYTKRDCFVYMDCDNEYYWNGIQLENGFIALKKTDFNILLLQEWLKFCEDERCLTDIPNQSGKENFAEFVDHRHDQSILSLLQLKYGIPTDEYARQFINFNTLFHVKGEKYSNGTANWKDGLING